MLLSYTLIIIAYLSGSIISTILVCKLFNLEDPRTGGSGNPGATNMLRLHGKKAAVLSLIGDVLKGVLPVALAIYLKQADIIIALCGLAAFCGHLFPVFFKFRGGKGVATLIGILLATHWLLGIAYIVTWLLSALMFRYASLSALIAVILTPLYSWLFKQNTDFLICYTIMAALLIWRHRSNIKNLLHGTERKIGQRA